MEIKLFVTVGDKAGASLGVRFLSDFFENRDRLRLTLCHMVREEPRTIGEISCDEPMCMLLKSGFSEQQIETHCLECGGSLAGKILESAEKGGYSAIVLGKARALLAGEHGGVQYQPGAPAHEILPAVLDLPPPHGRGNATCCSVWTAPNSADGWWSTWGTCSWTSPGTGSSCCTWRTPSPPTCRARTRCSNRAWTILEQRGFPGSRIPRPGGGGRGHCPGYSPPRRSR